MQTPEETRDSAARTTAPRPRTPVALAVLVAIALISATSAPSADTLRRQGDDAFARRDYEAALRYYEQAETLTLDPGLIAFNQAAAYFRLGKHREAIDHYRRCLEDDQAPPARRARAYFDLGNALLLHAGDDLHLLAQSAAAFRSCLRQPDLSNSLRGDARHNLELAQQLWLKAKVRQQQKTNPDDQPPPPKSEDDPGWTPADPKKDQKGEQDSAAPIAQKSRQLKSGTVLAPLADDDAVHALPPDAALATLEYHARRIAEQRRRQRHPDGPIGIGTKDW